MSPVHPRCSLRANRPVGHPETIQVDMVQQCGEPRIPLLPFCFTHTVQTAWHAWSDTVFGTCCTVRVPLGQPPFLHHLRTDGRCHRLGRYYGPPSFPCSFISGLRPWPFLSDPSGDQPDGRTWDLPVLAHGVLRTCPGSWTVRGPLSARDNAASDFALRSWRWRRHIDCNYFAAL